MAILITKINAAQRMSIVATNSIAFLILLGRNERKCIVAVLVTVKCIWI